MLFFFWISYRGFKLLFQMHEYICLVWWAKVHLSGAQVFHQQPGSCNLSRVAFSHLLPPTGPCLAQHSPAIICQLHRSHHSSAFGSFAFFYAMLLYFCWCFMWIARLLLLRPFSVFISCSFRPTHLPHFFSLLLLFLPHLLLLLTAALISPYSSHGTFPFSLPSLPTLSLTIYFNTHSSLVFLFLSAFLDFPF